MADPLGIIRQCDRCGAQRGEPCENWGTMAFMPDCPGEEIAYLPLEHVPEEVVEELRAEHLQASTIDATAEELGPPPPGTKPAPELGPPEVIEHADDDERNLPFGP